MVVGVCADTLWGMRARGELVAFAVLTALVGPLAIPAGAQPIPSGPAGSAFYQPPQPLRPAPPGALIWASSIPAPAHARAWRVLYHSRSISGKDIAVSGVIVVPTSHAPKNGRPVVTWGHGTTGLADICAPSRQIGEVIALPYIDDLVRAGYVVAATDYEGLGTPGIHPYLVGLSEGRGVLDAARVARHFTRTNSTTLIFGHSEGGQAALFAGELAPRYAPELRVVGVVAAAPAADIAAILTAAGAIPQAAGYVVMGAAGFHAAYPTADPASILTPDALADVPLAQHACSGAVIQQLAGTGTDALAHSPLSTPPWSTILPANSAGNTTTRAPILVVQGTADDLILPGLTDAFVEKACNAADTVDYDRYLGADHSSVIPAAQTDVLNWFAARTAGVPIVSSSCQHGPTDRQTPTLPAPTQPTPTPQTPTSRLGTD
jgi:hypothetical protein